MEDKVEGGNGGGIAPCEEFLGEPGEEGEWGAGEGEGDGRGAGGVEEGVG